MAGILVASAILLGVLLRDARIGWYALPLLVAGVGAALVYRTSMRTAALALLVLGAIALGAWRTRPVDLPPLPAALVAARSFEGKVLDVPRRGAESTQARIRLQTPASATIDVSLPSYPTVSQGDLIQFSGDLDTSSSRPRVIARQLAIRGSAATGPQRLRTRFLDTVEQRLDESVPQPAEALATGVLLGDDGAMTDSTRAAFRSAGLSHITAVSGWNVALVAGLFVVVGQRLRLDRRLWMSTALAGVWAFALIVGLQGSVSRAAVMATLFLVASWRGRPSDALSSVLWATALMIIIEPSMQHDIGFQLSVAATLGIVLGMPYLDRAAWLVESLAVPAIAEVSVAPLLLYHFGSFSLVSPLANLLVGPLIPPVMFGAMAVVIASLIHPVLASAVGILVGIAGRLVIGVAEWAASISWASGTVPSLNWGDTVVAYTLLGALYLALAWWRRRSRAVHALALSSAD